MSKQLRGGNNRLGAKAKNFRPAAWKNKISSNSGLFLEKLDLFLHLVEGVKTNSRELKEKAQGEGVMINLKNILKVLLIALFVCAWSGDNAWAVDYEKMCKDTCPNGTCVRTNGAGGWECRQTGDKKDDTKDDTKDTTVAGQGGVNDASFCSGNLGIFSELVQTGQMIFNRLRDLIYVVAGFGIIAVAVGGFFGNLNWKWLGAIVISLVVIATAGELIVLMTGCQSFNGSLITNTLTSPTPTMTTDEYNDAYTVETTSAGKISWDDTRDVSDYYGSTFSNSIVSDDEGSGNSEAGKENDAFQ